MRHAALSVLLLLMCGVAHAQEVTEFDVPTENGSPTSIVVARDGTVWFGESLANKIASVEPDGSIDEIRIPGELHGPRSLTVGADGNLWYARHTWGSWENGHSVTSQPMIVRCTTSGH